MSVAKRLRKIHRLVGEMLKKNADARHELKDAGGEVLDELEFTTQYYYDQVINNLKVLTTEQINVKLTVASFELFSYRLGVTYSDGGGRVLLLISSLIYGGSKILFLLSPQNGDDKIRQLLAEPNLSVISGEQASFLAGADTNRCSR
ncbi:hypothetical protein O9992_30635 [Vibrio lentus]|nr:hypothetical protein [Vibrio lentus]